MDNRLLEFCNTEFQRKCIEQAIKHDGKSFRWKLASQEIGAPAEKIRLTVRNVRRRASKRGWSPEHDMNKPCPETMDIKRISTAYDADGKVSYQWVIAENNGMFPEVLYETILDELRNNDIREQTFDSIQQSCDDDLLNLYTITDLHVGMLAWAEESGAEWNRDIAYDVFMSSINTMVQRSPNAKYGFLTLLGDFLHTDKNVPITPGSGHVLDAETRYRLLIRYQIRMIRAAMKMLMGKHEMVYLLVAEGNHDENGSAWCQEAFNIFYEENPSVKIINSPEVYYSHPHGNTMLAFHHGHKANPKKFAGLIPAKFPKIWGATEYRYGHVGHLHHKIVEGNGIIIEQHQTLSPKDAYSARGGYFAERGATCITYCKKQGEYSRITVRP